MKKRRTIATTNSPINEFRVPKFPSPPFGRKPSDFALFSLFVHIRFPYSFNSRRLVRPEVPRTLRGIPGTTTVDSNAIQRRRLVRSSFLFSSSIFSCSSTAAFRCSFSPPHLRRFAQIRSLFFVAGVAICLSAVVPILLLCLVDRYQPWLIHVQHATLRTNKYVSIFQMCVHLPSFSFEAWCVLWSLISRAKMFHLGVYGVFHSGNLIVPMIQS